MKKLSFIQKNNERHWVGDGFPVRSIFTYNDVAKEMSPFLLMDYAGPENFPPAKHRRGVGEHPHRGFETVTIVYDGEVEHRDSSGGGGVINKGDVQWMTAASGIVHDEFHGEEFAKTGGRFEMIQLWVNLPKKNKMAPPGYQAITDQSISLIDLDNNAGVVRVIAGQYRDTQGPAKTFSPMNVWDLNIRAGHTVEFTVPENWTTGLFLLSGSFELAHGEVIQEGELAVLERSQNQFLVKTRDDSRILLLNGEPIDEPIVGYGPFVMNSEAEIKQAFIDFQNGKMGRLDSP